MAPRQVEDQREKQATALLEAETLSIVSGRCRGGGYFPTPRDHSLATTPLPVAFEVDQALPALKILRAKPPPPEPPMAAPPQVLQAMYLPLQQRVVARVQEARLLRGARALHPAEGRRLRAEHRAVPLEAEEAGLPETQVHLQRPQVMRLTTSTRLLRWLHLRITTRVTTDFRLLPTSRNRWSRKRCAPTFCSWHFTSFPYTLRPLCNFPNAGGRSSSSA